MMNPMNHETFWFVRLPARPNVFASRFCHCNVDQHCSAAQRAICKRKLGSRSRSSSSSRASLWQRRGAVAVVVIFGDPTATSPSRWRISEPELPFQKFFLPWLQQSTNHKWHASQTEMLKNKLNKLWTHLKESWSCWKAVFREISNCARFPGLNNVTAAGPCLRPIQSKHRRLNSWNISAQGDWTPTTQFSRDLTGGCWRSGGWSESTRNCEKGLFIRFIEIVNFLQTSWMAVVSRRYCFMVQAV